MKNLKWLAAFLIVATLFSGIIGCKQEPEIQYVEKQPDGVAPADVTELKATNKGASVLLTWADATDEDIYGYEVTWKTSSKSKAAAAMEPNSMMVAPDTKCCYVTNLENGTEYIFTVKTVDTSGTKSAGISKTITPTSYTDVSLVPSTTEKTNQDVTVNVEINPEIAEKVEQILYLQGFTNSIKIFSLDITSEKSFSANISTVYTVATKYTDGTFDIFYIVIPNIDKTAPAKVANVKTTYSKETRKITLSWENPTDEDFVGTKIVYGLKDSEETTTLTFDKDTTETVLENIKTDTEGTYTVEIFTRDDVGNESDVKTKEIPMTIPSITSLSIPVAGISYAGQMLPVTIKGENLDSGLLYLETTGATLQNITVISSTKITAEIPCPSTVGTSEVTVTYGESSASTNLKVVETEKCFSVGDVLLTDGTRIKAENAQYAVPSGKAFAVIAYAPYGGGTGKAIGLQKSKNGLVWAPSDTKGNTTNFIDIQADYNGTSSDGYTFTGDLDGSDNWDYICKIDPEGTLDAATNYPVFNFALSYGTTAGLTETDYETGWYVPTVAEVYEVYKNKDKIQTSLDAAKGFTIGTSYYYCSSQKSSYDDYSYDVSLSSGSIYSRAKKSSDYVFVFQAFNAEQFNNYEYTTEISSVEIPTIAEGFTGEVPVTIKGKDLIQEITISGLTISTIDYISDAKAIAYATTTGTETETTIKVSCGTSSKTGTLKVVSAEKCFVVGDIILTDGTKVSVANVATYTIDESNKPIGVIVSTSYGGGVGKAIGLQKSASTLKWASDDTTGFNTNFTNIVCTPSKTGSGAASTATFTGDTDGSDNWEEICAVDPEGSADAATNYPIFNFANTYGTTAGLTVTDYENGWYVPSIAELCEVYKNKDVIQTSLTKAGGFTIGTSCYWSSSQYAYNYCDANRVVFDDGYVVFGTKYFSFNVFVLQAVTAK